MLDIRWVRQNPEEARAGLARRGTTEHGAAIDRILTLDEERRALVAEGDNLKARRNEVSAAVGAAKRQSLPADEQIAEMRIVGDRIKEIDGRLREIESETYALLIRIPNVPDREIPEGGEEANVVVRSWGEPRRPDFPVRPHWEIGAELGLMVREPACAARSSTGCSTSTFRSTGIRRCLRRSS
jgi:seryl-tRNA synthetase